MSAWHGGLRDQVIERPHSPIWWGATLPRVTVDELRDIWKARRVFCSRTQQWERRS